MALFKGERLYSQTGSFVEPTGNITTALKNAEGVTAANYTTFFIAPYALQITNVSAIWSTASSSGTLDVFHDDATEAPGGGSSIFVSGTFSTAGTANTVTSKTNISASEGTLAAGDRLSLVSGGTLTSLANLVVRVDYTIL